MVRLDVFDITNNKVGEIELSDKVFSAPINESLIYYAVKHYLAKGRSGTASSKGRSEVQGSGRKMWRQKGTGRARAGNIRNPLWRKGGIIFGPKPRDYDYHLPKKMKQGALRAVLSKRFKDNRILIIEDINFETPKTKQVVEMIGKFNVDGKFLIVDDISNNNLLLSIRNIPDGKALGGYGINVFDLLKYENLFISRRGIHQIEEVLGK